MSEKENLLKQLSELKQTIVKIEKRIAELPVEEMRFEKWNPIGGEWYVEETGQVSKSRSTVDTRNFGVERPTERQAIIAQIEMRKFNRLLAFRDELSYHNGKTLKNDWSCGLKKWFVAYDHLQNRWLVDYTTSRRLLGTVYFLTEEDANKTCEMLISGELVL